MELTNVPQARVLPADLVVLEIRHSNTWPLLGDAFAISDGFQIPAWTDLATRVLVLVLRALPFTRCCLLPCLFHCRLVVARSALTAVTKEVLSSGSLFIMTVSLADTPSRKPALMHSLKANDSIEYAALSKLHCRSESPAPTPVISPRRRWLVSPYAVIVI
jgi:hypothetical protein